jgi:hypothetical protein
VANYLRYANAGATRNQALDPKLVDALSFLQDMGITAEVFSGGQPSEGPNRAGSHRHDHGMSGDMRFYAGDRMLNWANEADRPIFEQIVSRGKQAGITGFGAGPGYMSEGSMHVGYGAPAVWGAGGSGDNAPNWLRKAFGLTINSSPAVAATGNAPMLDDPKMVATRPVIGTQMASAATPDAQPAATPTVGDKIGTAIFGDEMAAKLKASFGEGSPEKSTAKDGLGLIGKALGGGDTALAQAHAAPIQSSLPAAEAADAGRMAAAQQLMATLMAGRRKGRGGLVMGG